MSKNGSYVLVGNMEIITSSSVILGISFSWGLPQASSNHPCTKPGRKWGPRSAKWSLHCCACTSSENLASGQQTFRTVIGVRRLVLTVSDGGSRCGKLTFSRPFVVMAAPLRTGLQSSQQKCPQAKRRSNMNLAKSRSSGVCG